MQSQAHCPTDMSLDWIPTTATTRSQCTCSSPYWKQDYRHFRRAMELKWNPSSAFSRTTLKWGYLQAMHVADSQLINEMCWPSSPSSPADEGLRGCHVLFTWLSATWIAHNSRHFSSLMRSNEPVTMSRYCYSEMIMMIKVTQPGLAYWSLQNYMSILVILCIICTYHTRPKGTELCLYFVYSSVLYVYIPK